jgi:acyl dehydratase
MSFRASGPDDAGAAADIPAELRSVVAMTSWPNGMPHAGQRAERTRRVSARDIELFTEITGDRNPLHYDEAAAAASPFGEIIVQGGVTSGILNALVAEDLPGPGTVFLNASWDFKACVRPGDGVVALDGTAVCYTAPL